MLLSSCVSRQRKVHLPAATGTRPQAVICTVQSEYLYGAETTHSPPSMSSARLIQLLESRLAAAHYARARPFMLHAPFSVWQGSA